jgi:RHS repeat-associated protein
VALSAQLTGEDPSTVPLISNVVYSAVGETTTELANGSEERRYYDSRTRLNNYQLATTPGGSTYLDAWGLTYDVASNVLSMAANYGQGQWNYTYDHLNRLASAVSNQPTSCQFTYDPFGNRTGESPYESGSCYSETLNYSGNRITTPGYLYDAEGNLSSDGTNTYSYDGEDRLISVTNSATTLTYEYNPEGVRVTQTVNGTVYPNAHDAQGKLLWANYFTGSVYNELVGGGPEDVYFNGRHFGTLYVNENQAADTFSLGSVAYSSVNWLGTEMSRFDANQNLLGRYESLPYGDGEETIQGSASNDPLYFTGKERDQESNNDYFGARYYSSIAGRFLSADPFNAMVIKEGMVAGGLPVEAAKSVFDAFLENPQDWNGYAYALNNPLRNVDPSGAFAQEGHHLIVERGNYGPLGNDFTEKISTGPLSGNGAPNQPGFNEPHRQYNKAVMEMMNEAEETDGPASNWSLQQWKAFANEVLNSDEPAIKNFLDELEANNPGAKAALAAAISSYRVSAMLIARIVSSIIAADFSRTMGEIFLCVSCTQQEHMYVVTHKIVPPED